MFYLLVDIHQFSQFSIVDPERTVNLRASLQQLCTQWKFEPVEINPIFIFSNRDFGSGNHQSILNLFTEIQSMFAQHNEELHGYSLILEDTDEKNSRELTWLPLLVRERRGVYLGPRATKLLSHYFIGKKLKGLWKIQATKQIDDQYMLMCSHILERPFFDELLDQITPWLNGKYIPGEAHIIGEELNGLHLLGKHIIQKLTVAEAQGKIIYAVVENDDNLLQAIARSINVRDLDWVDRELIRLEQSIWQEKKGVLMSHSPTYIHPSSRGEQPENDMLILIQLYLRAFARWSRSRGSLPLIIIYPMRCLSENEELFLKSIMQEGTLETRAIWFFISNKVFGFSKPIGLERTELILPDYNKDEFAMLCEKHKLSEMEANSLAKYTEHKAIPLYHLLSIRELNSIISNKKEAFKRDSIGHSLTLLNEEARELLCVIMHFGLYLDREHIFSLFETRGKTRAQTDSNYSLLQNKGCLFYGQIHNLAFRREIEIFFLQFDDSELIQYSLNFILNLENNICLQFGLIEFIKIYQRDKYTLKIYRYMQTLIENRQFKQLENKKYHLQIRETDPLRLIEARLALEYRTFSKRMLPRNLQKDFWSAEWLIIQTLFNIQKGILDDAYQSCKSAIILCQDLKNDEYLYRAHNLFGYIHLRLRKYQEAIHYFNLTERNKKLAGNRNEIFAKFCSVLTNFIMGQYSRVKLSLENKTGLLTQLNRSAAHSWTQQISFLIARTYFALGDYEKAKITLTQQLNTFHSNSEQSVKNTFYAWIARCFIHQGMFKAAASIIKTLPQTLEVAVFKAEACIFRNDFDDALKVLRQPSEEVTTPYVFNFLFSWSNGFSWLEDSLVKKENNNNSLTNLKNGIMAFAMGKNDEIEKSIEQFHWLIKTIQFDQNDPYLSRILYWHSLILKESKTVGEDDWLTVLGRAVKNLQEKTSKIDVPEDKRLFLKAVFWNRKLFQKAKQYNLI